MSLPAWHKIEVTAMHPYPVFLDVPLEELGEYLQNRLGEDKNFFIVTQANIAKHYGERVKKGFKTARVHLITIPDGEQVKSLESLSRLTTEAIHCRIDRSSIVIALGGGVIGDLAGFFASVYMRGIHFVQVPTTLLAEVDSSIGGKVAINHPEGKNLLGAFYPPLAVWTDFSVLNTLPWEELQNGLAETIKHAIIADREFFAFLESHQKKIVQREIPILKEMATRSLAIKVKIVSEDEREQGVRALLNLGHTFGHALETEMEYEGISHGQGVSVGLVAAAYLAHFRGFLSKSELERILSLLQTLGLPISISGLDPIKLLNYMAADKKNKDGHKVLILPKGIGQAIIVRDCTDEEILQAWKMVIK